MVMRTCKGSLLTTRLKEGVTFLVIYLPWFSCKSSDTLNLIKILICSTFFFFFQESLQWKDLPHLGLSMRPHLPRPTLHLTHQHTRPHPATLQSTQARHQRRMDLLQDKGRHLHRDTQPTLHNKDILHNKDTHPTLHNKDTHNTLHSNDTHNTLYNNHALHNMNTDPTLHNKDTSCMLHNKDTHNTLHNKDTHHTLHNNHRLCNKDTHCILHCKDTHIHYITTMPFITRIPTLHYITRIPTLHYITRIPTIHYITMIPTLHYIT